MKPTPMTAFRSVTQTRVMPPQPTTKPPAYAARIAQHIALGRTPAQAMQAIERAEQPGAGRLPISQQDHNGGRGIKRGPRTNAVHDGLMKHLSHDWQPITPEFCEAIGVQSDCIRNNLKTLVARGFVECRNGGGRKPSMWRLPNA